MLFGREQLDTVVGIHISHVTRKWLLHVVCASAACDEIFSTVLSDNQATKEKAQKGPNMTKLEIPRVRGAVPMDYCPSAPTDDP